MFYHLHLSGKEFIDQSGEPVILERWKVLRSLNSVVCFKRQLYAN